MCETIDVRTINLWPEIGEDYRPILTMTASYDNHKRKGHILVEGEFRVDFEEFSVTVLERTFEYRTIKDVRKEIKEVSEMLDNNLSKYITMMKTEIGNRL